VAIVCAFFAPILAITFLPGSGAAKHVFEVDHGLWTMLGCGLVIAALGLYDDLRGAAAKQKLVVQVGVAIVLVIVGGYRIEHLQIPFGGILPIGMLAVPLSVLWIVGIVNALNLIDGLDGLAGGVALIAVIVNLVIGVIHGDAMTVLLMASLAGGIIGFLFYNLNPASIFMGDTGSMFLGFVLAAVSLRTSQKSPTAWALLVPVVVLGLPIADTLLAFLRRAMRGQSPFKADRQHIHHRLLDLGLTHRQTVWALYGTCAGLASAALLLTFSGNRMNALIVVAVGVLGTHFFHRLGFFRPAKALAEPGAELLVAMADIANRLQRATHVSEVLECVSAIAPAVGAAHVSAWTGRGHGALTATSAGQASDLGPSHATPLRARYPLADVGGVLEVVWADGRQAVGADEDAALADVSGHFVGAFRRVALRDTPLHLVRPVHDPRTPNVPAGTQDRNARMV
jgi:UDP-GlcNAc:undecaprenyl-phosphate/decaprenyl-phosphate GlcNAc-1-phosphate transferase